jgi:Dolichyl-phosphate-mannose-protein mannosyltransferase
MILLLGSSGIRVTYFAQLNATPLVESEHSTQSDMHYYDDWARQIAAGDWLSRIVTIPMHRWHHEVAQRYLATRPGEKALLADESQRTGADTDSLLWARWMRLPRFYQDPLYPYVIALTYRFVGSNVRFVYVWQLALGVLTNVLIWLLARRYFGDLVALVAASLALLCAPLLFYESLLLRDSTIVFAGLLLTSLTGRAVSQGDWKRFVALGIAVGLACLLKSTFFLFAAGILGALFMRRRASVGPVAAFTIGVALGLSLLAVRNVAVGAPPLSLASSGPLTFLSSNDVRYPPDVGFGIQVPLLATFLGETNGSWISAVRMALGTHTMESYASLVWRKWDRAWHWYEIPNNENFYYMRRQVPVLSWLPVTFWLCAPLALLGMALGLRRIRELWPLYLLVVVCVLPLVVFYVLGRFRIPLIAATLPFAAFALVEIIGRSAEHRPGAAAMASAAALVLGSWTGRPPASDQILIRTSDWISPYTAYFQTRVYGAADAKDWAAAARWYAEFFRRYEPTAAEIVEADDPSLAPELADMHRECAQFFIAAGNRAAADDQLASADRLMRLAGPH